MLLLCRTPFQASLLLRLCVVEGLVGYDLLYITQDDSSEDRLYFARLKKKARDATLLRVKRQRFDILNHALMVARTPRRLLSTQYERLYLASIDAIVFARLTAAHPQAEVRTFDDGTENILGNAFLVNSVPPRRQRLYRALLRAEPVAALHARIAVHFTIFAGFANMVSPDRVRLLPARAASVRMGGRRQTFFLGQPFEEMMTQEQIERLRANAKRRAIDWYVKHPRERAPLLTDVAILDKQGEVAEDAIRHAMGDGGALVIGAFSTVLFTLAAQEVDKLYLSLVDGPGVEEREALARRAGCAVELV